ncbi:unnamed protein product [Caenorhabditis sp. 36 PRJEB53466]|nr:unnamed protein product [Caenorhabditis sp. 36 PRJEB53466]
MLDPRIPPGVRLQKWTKEYGPYYGITEGTQKTLITSDPDFVNEVFVKQFDNFHGRKTTALQGDPNKNKRVHLLAAQGHRWKRLRTLSSPTFSNNSLRKILGSVEDSAVEVMRLLEEKGGKGETLDMLDFYQEFTLDVIGKIAMGQVESKMFENPMLERVKAIFSDGRKPVLLITGVFPFTVPFFRGLFTRFSSLQPVFALFDVMEKAVKAKIEQREADAQKGIEPGEPQDFIDLFLDVQADVEFFEGEAIEVGEFAKSQASKVDRHLTFDEIIGQCFVFLLAGYDTTALSLSYTTYLLARHPDVQRRVQQEMDRECPNPEVTFDQLSKLKYTEMVVKETLRMYPLASIVHSRKCMQSTTVLGLQIEEGTNVAVDTWTLHYDPKIWGPDAEEFKPERWSSGDESFMKRGYLPFGLGPRQCVGLRLAYMEEKLLLTHILRKYSFETTARTDIPLKLVGRATTAPTNVWLKLRARN